MSDVYFRRRVDRYFLNQEFRGSPCAADEASFPHCPGVDSMCLVGVDRVIHHLFGSVHGLGCGWLSRCACYKMLAWFCMSKIMPHCSCLRTSIMSVSSPASSSPHTLSVVQLESSSVRHPPTITLPLPSNYRRASAPHRRRRRPAHSADPPPSSEPEPPAGPVLSVPFVRKVPRVGSLSPDDSYAGVLGALLASAPCSQPSPECLAESSLPVPCPYVMISFLRCFPY